MSYKGLCYGDDPDELWEFFRSQYPVFKKMKIEMLKKEKQHRIERRKTALRRLWPFQNRRDNK